MPYSDTVRTITGPIGAVVDAVRDAVRRRKLTSDPRLTELDAALGSWSDRASAEHAHRIDRSLARLTSVFRLDQASAAILAAVAAPDIDPTFSSAYGLLLRSESPRPATVALALELAGLSVVDPVGRAAVGPAAPLRRWGLIAVDPGPGLLGRTVTVGEDVAAALVGAVVPDRLMADLTVTVPDSAGLDDISDPTVRADITAIAAALSAGHRLCWVETGPGVAGAALARAAFAAADIRVIEVDLARRADDAPVDTVLATAIRSAGLDSSALLVRSAEQLADDHAAQAAIRLAASSPVPVVLVGARRWNAVWHENLPVVFRPRPLPPTVRLELWRRRLGPAQVPDSALTAYRLTPEQIRAVSDHVVARAGDGSPDAQAVVEAVRILGGSAHGRPAVGGIRAGFDDLEVPPEASAELRRLADWVRVRDTVTSRGAVHGMGGKGTGIAALFTGSPGTGKTLAAHVIADTAGLDLLQVDLSGVIDKYIGETEKNLERVFAQAENLNVVLFFDEADALFGRRSEVKDAHDRFANQEVSYLLQRMEQFNGITVLATNLKGNLDVAFARRMHFIVHFPDPDEPTRRRLWSNLLARAGELDPDDPVNITMLASEVELAGGDLRNIVLAATYDAAIDGSSVGMRHIVAAAIREHSKLGRRVPSTLAR